MRANNKGNSSSQSTDAAAPAAAAQQHVDGTEGSVLAQTIASQLASGQYECMICTETIKHQTATWNCNRCFRVFHLYCTKKWAASEGSGDGTSFRCPSCQFTHPSRPKKYMCFCGKTVDPNSKGFATPHSCGEVCGKKRPNDCPHCCSVPCHPGPCPDCHARAPARPCPCGKTTYDFKCGHHDPNNTCGSVCGKKLNCGVHTCQELCHHGECKPCATTTKVRCVCGKHEKELICGSPAWSCEDPCGAVQRCGNCKCNVVCHAGSCPPCDRDVQLIATCPCGKKPLTEPRKECSDPIPLCGEVCGKVLLCGSHYCERPCHEGPCNECNGKIQISCPCHSTQRKVACKEASRYRCSQKCKTKLTCGRHECDVPCCLDKGNPAAAIHRCRRTCNKQLPCGHACDEPCHKGNCPRCHHIVTTELTCRCGAEVIHPPQPCGTEPPVCYEPCLIPPPCGHPPVPHNCHYGPCPPCTRTVVRRCVGDHVDLPAVLCSAAEVTCGSICGKILGCGHPCGRKCHTGPCLTDASRKTCGQICNKELPCGHTCPNKCHGTKDCQPCATRVEITCECGASTQSISCKAYRQKLEEATAARGSPVASPSRSRHASPVPDGAAKEGEEGHTEDGEKGASAQEDQQQQPDSPPKDHDAAAELLNRTMVTFPCTDDCAYQRRLQALQSVGNDRFGGLGKSATTAVRKTYYSLRVWSLAHISLEALGSVEKQIVAFAKSSAETQMLPNMTKDKRILVHELCWYFHIACEAVDREPHRSCFLTRTPRTAVPNPLLTKAVYDDNENPNAIAKKILKNKKEAEQKTIVMEGAGLNEITLHSYLKNFAGQVIVVPHADDDDCFFLVFPWGGDMNTGYSFLRRQGIGSIKFWRYGDEPASFGKKSPAPQQQQQSAARAPPAATPSKSWASMVKPKKTKHTDPAPLRTGNAFSALGRSDAQPRK